MFAKAYSIAREFTVPIIVSHRNAKGECSSNIGTFVIINEEGWFVTAFHIVKHLMDLDAGLNHYTQLKAQRSTLEADAGLKNHEKMRQLNGPLKINPAAITNFSIWPGQDDIEIGTVHCLPAVDLAVGQLVNFEKFKVEHYPLFKDPLKPMPQGTSLCKLGFPFHTIQPTFDESTNRFNLPPGALPIPIFPTEGIYTREVQVSVDPAPSYPLKFIETSSPGLRGQSGGPTVDVHGTVWAIQSQTHHLKLAFGSDTAAKDAKHLENQYLNVGWGIHAETLIAFFKEKNIAFQISTY